MRLIRPLSFCLVACLCLLANGSAPAESRSGTHVYLMRGLYNVSVGLDALAAKLIRRGIPATVYARDEADTVAAAAIRDYNSGKARSIVLIGHSLGAGGAIMTAVRLEAADVPVAVLITLDPLSDGAVPGNVIKAVNFHLGGALVAGATNVNLSGQGLDHMAIQSADSMHEKIMEYIR